MASSKPEHEGGAGRSLGLGKQSARTGGLCAPAPQRARCVHCVWVHPPRGVASGCRGRDVEGIEALSAGSGSSGSLATMLALLYPLDVVFALCAWGSY